jgi:hypothetical protein
MLAVFVFQPAMSMTEHVLNRPDLLLGESQPFDDQGVVVNQRARSLQEHGVV